MKYNRPRPRNKTPRQKTLKITKKKKKERGRTLGSTMQSSCTRACASLPRCKTITFIYVPSARAHCRVNKYRRAAHATSMPARIQLFHFFVSRKSRKKSFAAATTRADESRIPIRAENSRIIRAFAFAARGAIYIHIYIIRCVPVSVRVYDFCDIV